MVTAVILSLQPVAEARLPVSHGSFVHAAAMDLLLRLDPLLSHTLHQAAERKPFTCSPLGGTDQREGFDYVLSPDRLYTWRLTGLNAEISQQLLRLSPQLGGIRIGEAVFSVAHVSTSSEQHPEAGQDTYQALLARWTRPTQQPLSTVTLHFLTPTTFRIGGLEQPFPLPHWVLGSLLATWNAFSPYPLPHDLQGTLDEAVVLSNYKVETRRVELGGYRTVGFVGKCTYRVVKPSAEVGRLLGLLAAFSFYAGVGWQPTHGLGQVRPQFPAA
jgi:CRISPR-associated endoribonuclease Cas6